MFGNKIWNYLSSPPRKLEVSPPHRIMVAAVRQIGWCSYYLASLVGLVWWRRRSPCCMFLAFTFSNDATILFINDDSQSSHHHQIPLPMSFPQWGHLCFESKQSSMKQGRHVRGMLQMQKWKIKCLVTGNGALFWELCATYWNKREHPDMLFAKFSDFSDPSPPCPH